MNFTPLQSFPLEYKGPTFPMEIYCGDQQMNASNLYLDFPIGVEYTSKEWSEIYKSVKRLEHRINQSQIFCK